MIKINKENSLAQQIESARKAFDEWPAWMKSVAYVSSTVLSTDSAKQVLEDSGHSAVQVRKATSK
jgi:hypothetical protein